MWTTCGDETMVAEEQLASDKVRSVFRFAGAFVGSAVVTGKEITGFGVECGKKAGDLCRASAAAVGGIRGQGATEKRRSLMEAAEQSPGLASVQTAAAAPIANEAEEASQPQRPEVMAPTPAKSEYAQSARKAPTVPPVKTDTEAVKAKGPEPEVAYPTTPAFRHATSEEIEGIKFTGTAQKVLFTKALSDLTHQDAITRAHAAKAMGGIRHELSMRALATQFFREDSAQVRKECVNALAMLGMKEALPVVEHALNDSDGSVRIAAVKGEYRLAGAQSASALTRMLSDDSVEVRRMVATCIGWLGQEHLAVELVPLLRDKAARVRQAAVEAMGNLGSREVVFTLIEYLNDSDESVRKKLTDVLEQITGKKMGEGYPADEEGRQRLTARWRHWWKEEPGR